MRGNETPGRIVTNCCTGAGVHDVITCADLYYDRLRGLGVAGGQILAFSIDLLRRPDNTLALPCECVLWYVVPPRYICTSPKRKLITLTSWTTLLAIMKYMSRPKSAAAYRQYFGSEIATSAMAISTDLYCKQMERVNDVILFSVTMNLRRDRDRLWTLETLTVHSVTDTDWSRTYVHIKHQRSTLQTNYVKGNDSQKTSPTEFMSLFDKQLMLCSRGFSSAVNAIPMNRASVTCDMYKHQQNEVLWTGHNVTHADNSLTMT